MIKGIDPGRRYNNWNIHSLIIEAPKILTDIKREIDSNTKIVADFNTPLTSKDRPSRQKMDKEILALNDILHQNILIDV